MLILYLANLMNSFIYSKSFFVEFLGSSNTVLGYLFKRIEIRILKRSFPYTGLNLSESILGLNLVTLTLSWQSMKHALEWGKAGKKVPLGWSFSVPHLSKIGAEVVVMKIDGLLEGFLLQTMGESKITLYSELRVECQYLNTVVSTNKRKRLVKEDRVFNFLRARRKVDKIQKFSGPPLGILYQFVSSVPITGHYTQLRLISHFIIKSDKTVYLKLDCHQLEPDRKWFTLKAWFLAISCVKFPSYDLNKIMDLTGVKLCFWNVLIKCLMTKCDPESLLAKTESHTFKIEDCICVCDALFIIYSINKDQCTYGVTDFLK